MMMMMMIPFLLHVFAKHPPVSLHTQKDNDHHHVFFIIIVSLGLHFSAFVLVTTFSLFRRESEEDARRVSERVSPPKSTKVVS